jgi:hypothetical protein
MSEPARVIPLWSLPLLLIILTAPSCSLIAQGNRNPVIVSVTASPDTIHASESTTVYISATDPDGDHLVYDWVTDARLTIKGNPPNKFYRYNTDSPSQIFYPGPTALYPLDTAWVQCFARDGRGGMSRGYTINIMVKH